ncbi:hypothetical protein [Pontibacter sp. G13]|uniref:hypothetical protein n=1 Tax=Pontibacter sp. G13 TaxID=3074898 RepID=UPI00288A289E|nr:hypothetical protein [Pontibacter sp. G13]WNJ16951.1 hypothetical protein RJD25_19025 [Pontibacter sp. G13]
MKYLNRIALAMLFVMGSVVAHAQVETSVPFMKKNKGPETAPGITMDCDIAPEKLQAALDEHFKDESKIKGRKVSKDLYEYEGAHLTAVSTQSIDYYFRLQDEGKKKDPQTRFSMVMSYGNDNFLSSTNDNDREIESAKTFMEDIYERAQQMDWDDQLEEMEKRKEDLAKQKKDLDEQIQQNEEQMKLLDGKRKGIKN